MLQYKKITTPTNPTRIIESGSFGPEHPAKIEQTKNTGLPKSE